METKNPLPKVRQADALAEEFCNKYCRWPYELSDQEALDARCSGCPLDRLVDMAKKK